MTLDSYIGFLFFRICVILYSLWQLNIFLCNGFTTDFSNPLLTGSLGSDVFRLYVHSVICILAICHFGHVSLAHMSVRPIFFWSSVLPSLSTYEDLYKCITENLPRHFSLANSIVPYVILTPQKNLRLIHERHIWFDTGKNLFPDNICLKKHPCMLSCIQVTGHYYSHSYLYITKCIISILRWVQKCSEWLPLKGYETPTLNRLFEHPCIAVEHMCLFAACWEWILHKIFSFTFQFFFFLNACFKFSRLQKRIVNKPLNPLIIRHFTGLYFQEIHTFT